MPIARVMLASLSALNRARRRCVTQLASPYRPNANECAPATAALQQLLCCCSTMLGSPTKRLCVAVTPVIANTTVDVAKEKTTTAVAKDRASVNTKDHVCQPYNHDHAKEAIQERFKPADPPHLGTTMAGGK